VAIRSPKHNSQGYTLLEMLAVTALVGIVMGLGLPSLISLKKPLRDGTSQFKSALGLVRSKAIASNQAYRIKPMYLTRAEYTGTDNPDIPNKFVVESAANCSVTAANGWTPASQFDLVLPNGVGITDSASTTLVVPASPSFSVTVSNSLNWNDGQGICFDNRGVVDRTLRFILKDFQDNNQAKIALFNVTLIGGVEIATYDKNNISFVDSQGKSGY
jgi:prepilin-type N-terminal cleavage/methylation domain-containing protein